MVLPLMTYPFSTPHQPSSGWAQVTQRSPHKRILYGTDIDGTLIKWLTHNTEADTDALAGMRAKLTQLYDVSVIALKTGRGLTALKTIAHFLTGIPVDLLSLNNGQELYINRHAEPVDQWVDGLTRSHQDPDWQTYLNTQHRWDLPRLIETFHETVQAAGFKPVPNEFSVSRYYPDTHFYVNRLPGPKDTHKDPLLLYEFFDDEASLIVKSSSVPLPEPLRKQATQLVSQVIEKLQQQGTQVEVDSWYDEQFNVFLFSPKHISKAAKMGYLVNRLRHIQAVISAGDHSNDKLMLQQPFFARHAPEGDNTAQPEQVPNYAIISGTRLGLDEMREHNPHIEQSLQPGYLHEGVIDRQLAKIPHLLPDREVPPSTSDETNGKIPVTSTSV